VTEPGDRRTNLRDLLARLEQGVGRPQDAFAEARAVWLSGLPRPHEPGYDAVAQDVLFLIANAREMGVTHEDAAALRAYLEARPGDAAAARERLYEHVTSVDPATREALQQNDDYYGPRSEEADDEAPEIYFSDPEERRVHRGVRLDPESVWDAVRDMLRESPPRNELFLAGLVEDLMYSHAEGFIDRIEAVAEESANAGEIVVMAYVGGIAPSPAHERFWSLQDRLQPDAGSRDIHQR
jgi:hypothetical protein